jgi:signal recognition particle subunit SRP19
MSERQAEDKWICLYPLYIDISKSLSEGRKVPKAFACENPYASGIVKVIQDIPLPCGIEPKSHPKDFWKVGRVRVALFKDNGEPFDERFKTRQALLRHVGQNHPKLVPRSSPYECRDWMPPDSESIMAPAGKIKKKKMKKIAAGKR